MDYSHAVSIDFEQGNATGFDSISGMNTLLGSNYNDSSIGDTNNNLFVIDFGDTLDRGMDLILFCIVKRGYQV